MIAEAPINYRFSVTQYHQLGESGILPADARLELIEGRLIEMAPMVSWHAYVVNRLTKMFIIELNDRAFVSIQSPLILGDHSEPEPDIALLRPPANRYRDALPSPTDVLLLIEVADSTARYDHQTKVPLYAAHGIPEVWVVERDPGWVSVYRGPLAEQRCYQEERRVIGGGLSPGAFADIQVVLEI